jgi:hypothetical protein
MNFTIEEKKTYILTFLRQKCDYKHNTLTYYDGDYDKEINEIFNMLNDIYPFSSTYYLGRFENSKNPWYPTTGFLFCYVLQQILQCDECYYKNDLKILLDVGVLYIMYIDIDVELKRKIANIIVDNYETLIFNQLYKLNTCENLELIMKTKKFLNIPTTLQNLVNFTNNCENRYSSCDTIIEIFKNLCPKCDDDTIEYYKIMLKFEFTRTSVINYYYEKKMFNDMCELIYDRANNYRYGNSQLCNCCDIKGIRPDDDKYKYFIDYLSRLDDSQLVKYNNTIIFMVKQRKQINELEKQLLIAKCRPTGEFFDIT